VSAHDHTDLSVWDAITGREFFDLHGHNQRIFSLAFSPDGQFLASGSSSDLTEHHERGSIELQYWGELKLWGVHRQSSPLVVENSKVALSPDGRLFATPVGPDEEQTAVAVRETAGGLEVRRLEIPTQQVNDLRFSSDGRRLLMYRDGEVLDVRDMRDGRPILKVLVDTPSDKIRDVAISPDGRRLAWAFSGDGEYQLRGVFLREAVDSGEAEKGIDFFGKSSKELVDTVAYCVEFSPDGRYLASSATRDYTDCQLTLWDVETGEPVRTFRGHTLPASSLVFSPDGKRLASAGFDEAVKIWDVATGDEVHSFAGIVGQEDYDISHLAFRPDGLLLAAARGSDVTVLDLSTGQIAFVLRGREGKVDGLAFGADGKSLVATSQNKVWRWDVPARWETPEERQEAEKSQRLQWHRSQASEATDNGRWFAARFHFDRLLEAAPADGEWLAGRGRAYLGMDLRDRAAADYARAVESKFETLDVLAKHAQLRVQSGDLDGYRRSCARLLERFGDAKEPIQMDQMAWTCVLGPRAVAGLDRVVELAEKAVKDYPGDYAFLETLGAALYRDGKFREAVQQLEKAVKAHDNGGTLAEWHFLAMARHRLGQADEARKWLAKASDWLEKKGPEQPREGKVQAVLSIAQLLHREARDLLGATPE
jgi:WD40 repeat protein